MASVDNSADGKLDLVPMIDCIMLLLLFFILTTKFSSEEKVIGAMLPTEHGGTIGPKELAPDPIAICVYPAGFTHGMSAQECQHALDQRGNDVMTGTAWLRIGNREPLAIDGALLHGEPQAVPGAKNPEIERIDAYVFAALTDYEKPGDRSGQDPVSIASFSGMSWKFALVTYDAVRAYEATKRPAPSPSTTGPTAMTPDELQKARAVDFLPPPLRASSGRELGDELADILRR